ncbi:hypothetical protein GGF46_001959 [Coemansia sp. RSA 552]|nr:hypothetical protein GGF46_001959 [Coemansia sp. RSA 552]
MPNIFSRLRRRGTLGSPAPSSQIPLADSDSVVAGPEHTGKRRSSPRYWGPRASTYASNMARRSTDHRHSIAEPGGPADDTHPPPAGLKQPWQVLRRSIFSSWINVLLLLVPVGIASHPAGFSDVAVFVINFFAIIPLAKILGYATEQLALHLGEALGGLLNATFGNAVELLVGILALVKGQIEIVQTSLVGSILSNLLLVGGCCFFLGGIKNNEQVFNAHAAQSYGSLLAMAILSTLLPAAYNSLNAKDADLKSGTLTLSHVTAIFLLVIYIAYLFFQLKTHANLFSAVPAEWNLSPSFVGMILLPIVGNAAEHVTAVTVAMRNKMDLALGVAVGSSIQIALFVMPFLCILGWIIGKAMTIYFSPFTTVVLFVTVLLVNYIIGDGRTNWLEGLVLIMSYAIIGVAYFLYPKDMDTSSL